MERVCPHWLSFILDNPIRRRFTDRASVVRRLSARSGDTILEMGCGNGFFTPHLLDAAEGVRVIMADIQPRMVSKALRKLTPEQTRRVSPIATHAREIGLGDAAVQRVFLYFVFHEVVDKEQAARELYRVVSPGGLLAVWEPKVEVSEKLMAHFSGMFQSAGFVIRDLGESRRTRFLLCEKAQ